MKVLLDEDVPVQLLDALVPVLDGHRVEHVQRLGWNGKKDLNLLPDAARRGYQVLVTNDKNQLNDPDECRAIRDSGLHHVRYDQDTKLGKEGLGLAMASVLAAAAAFMRDLEAADSQRLVHVQSIRAHARAARYRLVDPIIDPPVYWARGGAAPRRPRR